MGSENLYAIQGPSIICMAKISNFYFPGKNKTIVRRFISFFCSSKNTIPFFTMAKNLPVHMSHNKEEEEIVDNKSRQQSPLLPHFSRLFYSGRNQTRWNILLPALSAIGPNVVYQCVCTPKGTTET